MKLTRKATVTVGRVLHHARLTIIYETLLEPQYRVGDEPLKLQVVHPQNGTAVLKGLKRPKRQTRTIIYSGFTPPDQPESQHPSPGLQSTRGEAGEITTRDGPTAVSL